ncbi:MAG: hypothetical protein ABIO47_04330 [Sphingomicrobium sp.]
MKDYIEISEFTSLARLISYLETIRDNLPADCEAEMQVRGDETFGRRLSISYFRELTPEEAAVEARYSPAELPPSNPAIDALRHKLDDVP